MNTSFGNFQWKGASGAVYEMAAFGLDVNVKPDIEGNYVFGELYDDSTGALKIRAIYIGEGILKDRIEFRIREGRVQKKGCNCVCMMINTDEKSRKQIEDDLLAANPNAYEPDGCNIKIGG